LRNPKFLDGLPSINKAAAVATLSEAKRTAFLAQLQTLNALAPQPRGYAFEEFLKDLFSDSNLAPRSAFRLVGEQIDGSFALQGETYLLEATWRSKCVGEEELMSFSGKVSGKAAWSRGLHLSYAANAHLLQAPRYISSTVVAIRKPCWILPCHGALGNNHMPDSRGYRKVASGRYSTSFHCPVTRLVRSWELRG
jgi:hypothetical protein